MSGPNFENIALAIIDAFQPAVEAIIDTLPFPLNGAIALIWGGIKEILLTVIFG